MIGDSKIGGPGIGPPVTLPTEPDPPATPAASPAPVAARDKFELAAAADRPGGAAAQTGSSSGLRELSRGDDLLQLARENPAAARQVVADFAAKTGTILNEIERELAGARVLCDQLAKERFNRKALEASRRELRKQRSMLTTLKLRHQLTCRKMALLQQIAGRLGDPRLDEEIDRILTKHKRLKTSWGRRQHLLSAGTVLYGSDAESPAHLSHVVKTPVRTAGDSEQTGETLAKISPRLLLADLMARTLDGSTRPEADESAPSESSSALCGELGPSVRNWSLFSALVDDVEDEDPFE